MIANISRLTLIRSSSWLKLRRLTTNTFSLSKLPNGIRVASVNSPGPCVSTGILVEARRNGQTPPIPGHSSSLYILEKLGFKATKNLGESKMQEKLDELVGVVQSKASRESILYSGAIVPNSLKSSFELFREVVSHPLVTEKDLDEMSSVVAYELDELKSKPDQLLPELAHGPAFYSNFKISQDHTNFMDWNSLVSFPKDLRSLTVKQVMRFWEGVFVPKNMIILGAGMPHGELYNTAVDTFSNLDLGVSGIADSTGQDLTYTGGANYIEMEDLPLVHMVIGFEGCKANSEQAFPLAILQMLMGGGNSFSAGGPGKGMYSRLYTQVLNRYHWIDACKVFNFSYSSGGLFGIHGSSLPSHSRDLGEVLLDQIHSMTLPLTSIEFERAKNQVKSSVLMGLESRLTELEDLADQVSHLNTYISPFEICKRIDNVSIEDLQNTAKALLKTRPTVVAYGPLHRVPSYETILKWHQSLLSKFI